jgi:hypothetical protein
LEPFFDVVPVIVVEMTAEIVPSKSGQVAHAVDEKFSVVELMDFSKSMRNAATGSVPRRLYTLMSRIHFESVSMAA